MNKVKKTDTNAMKLSKKNIQDRLVSRRQFLVGAGSTFLALPPLLSLMPREAAAQAARKKVRSVVYIGYLGIDRHQLVPITDPAGLVTVPGEHSTRYKTLSSFGGGISRVVDSSFVSMYPHMNLFKGLSLTGGNYQGHNASVLCGSHSGFRNPIFGKSIDIIMEQSASVYKPGEIIKQKALRIGGSGMSFDRVNGVRINSTNLKGDLAVFNQLFGSFIVTNTGNATQNNTNSKLIVDRVYSDLKSLEGNRRLSSSDKILLDRYMTGFQEVQQKVQANIAGLGPKCTVPSLPIEVNQQGNTYQFPSDTKWGIVSTSVLFDNYIEMIKMAFLCDLTRIVHMENSVWSDLPISTSSAGGLHHECASSDLAADRQAWGIKKMLKLATVLQSTPDPQGGTLLDNSTVLCTNELGNWTTGHSTLCMPAILFGRGGGAFKTGYYVDYSQPRKLSYTEVGRPYKQLLQSIMNGMGVPRTEYMQFGDGNGFGEFKEGIDQFGKKMSDAFSIYRNEHNDLLPFITNG